MGNMWPIVNGEPKNRTTYPWGHKFEVDQQAVSDCALSATMLSGAVENSLKGIPAKCSYECDTEFGCELLYSQRHRCRPCRIKGND